MEEDKYIRANNDRKAFVDAILNSLAKNKIVVAGPGTGKTFLFKKVLEGKDNTLTLTFVNSLVEDLSLELYGLSDVRTLHSFARSIVGKARQKVKVFPKLSEVIRGDARILIGGEIDFDAIFHDRDDTNPHIDFYRRRKDYYDHYGYADIVYAAVRLFEEKPERIPSYEQVLVDEFQDFNKLEVSLIDALATKSPMLLAGDDDQALYAFKKASAEHIRQRHTGNDSGYEAFTLPFCSRCTRVIVDSINDLLKGASNNGLLRERITKEYRYLDLKEKDADSDKHQTIGYTQIFTTQIPWFIAQQIGKIAEEARSRFSILIISPTKTQCRKIAEGLRKKGFQNVTFHDRQDEREATKLDGLKLLLEDEHSNLGWRILAQELLPKNDFEALLKGTSSDNPKPLHEVMDSKIKKEVKGLLKTMRAVRDEKEVDGARLVEVLKDTPLDPSRLARAALADELSDSHFENPGIRKLPIKVTTIPSSKGLADEYVFVTHFDNQFFGGTDKRPVADQDVCNLLVALTRARKKAYLVSSKKEDPVLLTWIDPRRIERVA